MVGTIFLWTAAVGGALFLLVLAFATYEQAYHERRAKRLRHDPVEHMVDRHLPAEQVIQTARGAAAAAQMTNIAA